MHKLGRGTRDKVQQFMAITGASEKVALQALKASDWHLEGAFDVFYSQPQVSVANSRLVEELFSRYKEPDADMIMVEGISQLCNDLQVDPRDIVMLVISWHMKASTMCEFTCQEFIGGLQSIGVDSTEKLREKLPSLRAELKDDRKLSFFRYNDTNLNYDIARIAYAPNLFGETGIDVCYEMVSSVCDLTVHFFPNPEKFREIYNFAFTWAREKGQKSLSLETAIGMWQLLFAERHWPLIDYWCQFLQIRHNKAISRDTWAQLLEFVKTIDPQLTNYDEEGAWPYLIDEFVEHLIESGVVQRVK